ncbi:hypothetical protein KFU94_36355 [Chloroflexi bacterium TSY]|nr:hypothetical protein [Chloroflexi bacterium TSY]
MEDRQLINQELVIEKDQTLPQYEVPQVITYTDQEILEQLGPAQAVYGVVTP